VTVDEQRIGSSAAQEADEFAVAAVAEAGFPKEVLPCASLSVARRSGLSCARATAGWYSCAAKRRGVIPWAPASATLAPAAISERTSSRFAGQCGVVQFRSSPLDRLRLLVVRGAPTRWSLRRPSATTPIPQNPAQRLVAALQS